MSKINEAADSALADVLRLKNQYKRCLQDVKNIKRKRKDVETQLETLREQKEVRGRGGGGLVGWRVGCSDGGVEGGLL